MDSDEAPDNDDDLIGTVVFDLGKVVAEGRAAAVVDGRNGDLTPGSHSRPRWYGRV